MLRAPVEIIIFFPFALEGFAISGPRPEFGLFQIDGVNASIDDPLDMLFLHILDEVLARNNIRNHVAVPYRVAMAFHLSFVEVHFPIPLAGEVIFITAPGNASHKMRDIAPVSP